MVGSSWLKQLRLLVKKVVKHWFKLKTSPVKMRINLLARSTAFNKIGYIGLHSYACSQREGTTVFLSGLGLNVPRNKSSPTCLWSWRAFKLEDISCGLILKGLCPTMFTCREHTLYVWLPLRHSTQNCGRHLSSSPHYNHTLSGDRWWRWWWFFSSVFERKKYTEANSFISCLMNL